MKKIILLSLLCLSYQAWCGVDVGFCVNFDCRGSLPDVNYRGTCEATNAVYFCISDDDFPDASPGNPVYLRFQLSHGARLCETLVGPNEPYPLNQPINLVMFLEGPDPLMTVRIPEDSSSIVRWVAGEPEFWIRISSSTSGWIERGGSSREPPSASYPIQVAINPRNYQGLFDDGLANSPFHSRDGATPVALQLLTDLRLSTLRPMPEADSVLSYDASGYDSSTLGVETADSYTSILLGNDPDFLVRTFCADLARGFTINGVPTLNDVALLGFVSLMLLAAIVRIRMHKENGSDPY